MNGYHDRQPLIMPRFSLCLRIGFVIGVFPALVLPETGHGAEKQSVATAIDQRALARHPTLERAEHVSFEHGGFLGKYLEAISENWLTVAPDKNPIMLDVFRDRQREPYRRLEGIVGEYAGKYFTGAVEVLRLTHDQELKAYLKRFADELVKLQGEDGYLGPWPRAYQLAGRPLPSARSPDDFPWDAWGHYHLMLGLLHWHEDTGDATALGAARKIGDLLCDMFLENAQRSIATNNYRVNLAPLHSLCLLYKKTGERRYLALARQIVNEEFSRTRTGEKGSLPTNREQEGGLPGNNYVRDALAGKEYYQFPEPRWECLHTILGLIELYWITGEEDYRKAFEHIWWSIVKLDRHNTGAFSSHEGAIGNPYDLGSIETCCVVAWTAMGVDMLRLTGNSIVADELELTLVNAVLGYQSRTGKWATYTTPMDGTRESCTANSSQISLPDGRDLHCCACNSARGFGLLSEWALMKDEQGLVLNWYGPSTTSANVKGVPIRLKQLTGYPRTGRIELEVSPERPVEFSMKLRIPHWSAESRVAVNGTAVENVLPGRYLAINRPWKPGDRITIDLDMSLHYWMGERECQGKTSIYRGPVLLAYNPKTDQDRPALDAKNINCRLVESEADPVAIVLLECQTVGGEKVLLRDFNSAGEDGNRYISWLKVLNVSATPFSTANPLRSSGVK